MNDKLDSPGRMCVTNDNSLRVNANQFQFHRVFTDYDHFYCSDNVSTNSRLLATTLFYVLFLSEVTPNFPIFNSRAIEMQSADKKVKKLGGKDVQRAKSECKKKETNA